VDYEHTHHDVRGLLSFLGVDVVQMSSSCIGLLLNQRLLSRSSSGLSLVRPGCIGAPSCIHLGGALTRKVPRLPTSETTISRSTSWGIGAGVVVVTSSSGTVLWSWTVGVLIIGAVDRGGCWGPLRWVGRP
jgi:hypothetical protein